MSPNSLLSLPQGSRELLGHRKGLPGATPHIFCPLPLHPTGLSVSQLCGFIYWLHTSCLPPHPVRGRAALKNTTSSHTCSLLRISGLSLSVSFHTLKACVPQVGLALVSVYGQPHPPHIGLFPMFLFFGGGLYYGSLFTQPG